MVPLPPTPPRPPNNKKGIETSLGARAKTHRPLKRALLPSLVPGSLSIKVATSPPTSPVKKKIQTEKDHRRRFLKRLLPSSKPPLLPISPPRKKIVITLRPSPGQNESERPDQSQDDSQETSHHQPGSGKE
jgi:hypothetical protein